MKIPLINGYNNLFELKPLKIILSLRWIVVASLTLPVVVGSYLALKAIAVWSIKKRSDTEKANNLGLKLLCRVFGIKTLEEQKIELIVNKWIEEASPEGYYGKSKEFLSDFFGSRSTESQRAKRIRAKQHILQTVASCSEQRFYNFKEQSSLYLNYLDLTSLPDIFHHEPFKNSLITLELQGNNLYTLPESIISLPLLKELNLTNTGLKYLSETMLNFILDKWIEKDRPGGDLLRARERILEFFNDNSTGIDLSHLQLTSLPDIFHHEPFKSRLQALVLTGNPLKDLSRSAFCFILDKWETQDVGSEERRFLPSHYIKSFSLFPTTNHFRLENTNLTSLPDIFYHKKFQEEAQTLDFSDNRLQSLPEFIGKLSHLTYLNLRGNSTLSGIPMQLLDLPSTCTIDLTGCNLSEAVWLRLREITSSSGYVGPRISYSVNSVRRQDGSKKTIQESLSDLYRIVGKSPVEFSNLAKTEELRSWLYRLSDIADYKKGGELKKTFANKIIGYLHQANEDQKFREIFYSVIQDASTTCGDRMALSVLHLGIAYQLATIDLKDMKGLADLLKGVWAINMLETIARNKIPTLPFFDEIEVYLGYPIKLKEELNLPIDVQEMLYFTCSALKPEDLQKAKADVLREWEDQEKYFTFLIGNDKWKQALSVNYAEEYKAIWDKREEDSELENPNYAAIEQNFHEQLKDLTKKALR